MGSERDNSPFRGARPKLTSYSDSPYPKPHSMHFLVPPGIFGRIYRTEPASGRNSSPGRAEILFGPVKRLEKSVGTMKCMEWGFGYGESEYEVSFCQATRNEDLSPSDPKATEPLTLSSGPGTRNGVQIRIHDKIWDRSVKSWCAPFNY